MQRPPLPGQEVDPPGAGEEGLEPLGGDDGTPGEEQREPLSLDLERQVLRRDVDLDVGGLEDVDRVVAQTAQSSR